MQPPIHGTLLLTSHKRQGDKIGNHPRQYPKQGRSLVVSCLGFADTRTRMSQQRDCRSGNDAAAVKSHNPISFLASINVGGIDAVRA